MISNVMFWSDHRCFDRTMMQKLREQVIMRGLPVYSPILFACETFQPGNVVALSSVNAVEKKKTENDQHCHYTFLVHTTIVSSNYDTTENLFKIYILFYIVGQTDQLLLVTKKASKGCSVYMHQSIETLHTPHPPPPPPAPNLWGIDSK